jgi:Flp pilus assembly protein TadD
MRWDTSVDRARRGVVVELARRAAALRPDDARQWELLAHALLPMERDDEGRSRPTICQRHCTVWNCS